jgi:hypothetical protein
VVPALLYGYQNYVVNKENKRIIEITEMNVLRSDVAFVSFNCKTVGNKRGNKQKPVKFQ